jgi:type II secretory pathway predicted ATPase ExeA
MLSDVIEYFGFKKELDHLGYFETDEQKNLFKELNYVIRQGRLIALSGMVGSGKTTTLQSLISHLRLSKEVMVSCSLAVDKNRVNLGTLITALFYDLSTEKELKLPTQPEQRERKLLALIQKCRKPVVLMVDDAHNLHPQTLVGLKSLIELVRHNQGKLSVLLAGHPKLKNDLRRPTLEEIGARANVFSLEGIRGHQKEYIEWILHNSSDSERPVTDFLTESAYQFLADSLVTPLQIEQYLSLAFEAAHRVATKPVTKEILQGVLAYGLDDLEPRLIRQGYNVKVLSELLNLPSRQVRSFLYGQLPPGQSQELKEQMLKLGIPLLAS